MKKKLGRPFGTFGAYKDKIKDVKFFGYKYYLEDAEYLKRIFESYKIKYNYKTTEALYEILKKINEIENLKIKK